MANRSRRGDREPRHIIPVLGRRKLKNLSRNDVRRLYRIKRDEGLSNRSLEYIHTTLHRALRDAKSEGKIYDNPTDGVRPHKTPQGAVEALKAHGVRQNEERLKAGSRWKDHGLVFPNTIGKPMNAGNFYRREFQPVLEQAGLSGEGFTFHSLRHTFATALAARNVNPATAQKMLGHADIRMTLAIYTHATDEMQDAATAALESTFG